MARSKSKSPRRKRREAQQLPSPPATPALPSSSRQTLHPPDIRGKKPSLRRRHSSGAIRASIEDARKGVGSDAGGGSTSASGASGGHSGGMMSMKRRSSARGGAERPYVLGGTIQEGQVRAWEEELGRIEDRSRKTSEGILGLLGVRKRVKT